MELNTVVILVLLLAGVIGSLVPMMPGALLSLSGILFYLSTSGKPNWFFIILGLLTAGTALLFDWLAGSVAAKYGGASKRTSIAAGFTGFLGFIFLGGPFGLAAAVFATVLVREYLIHSDRELSFKAAFYASVGVLGSGVIQFVLTSFVLLSYILVLVI